MAILGILAGLVAGAVTGLGNRGQQTRLDGDRDSIQKAANAFSLEAFPEKYPVLSLDDTAPELVVSPDLGVRLIDLKASLPQDPTKKFVPNFLTKLPESSALVSWRIDTRSGEVFFANDGAPLIKPSSNELNVSASDSGVSAPSDYTVELIMAKNTAALQTLELDIPAGYSIGGTSASRGTLVGVLNATLDADNGAASGQKVYLGGVVVSSGEAGKWLLVVDYNDNITGSGNLGVEVKPASEAVRVHDIEIATPSSDLGGKLTLEISRGNDPPQNQATETWKLTILGEAVQDVSPVIAIPPNGTASFGGLQPSARVLDTNLGYLVKPPDQSGDTGLTLAPTLRIVTNPETAGVKRWNVEENTTIDVIVGDTAFFHTIPGSQGVLIKAGVHEFGADTTAPTVSAPSSITVAAESASGTPDSNAAIAALLVSATAADDVDGALTVTNDAPVIFPVGDTIVTFSATDAANNTGTDTATVTVTPFQASDTTLPVLTVPSSITVAADSASGTPDTNAAINALLVSATANDDVDGALTVTNDAPEIFPVGVTIVTFSATDAANNTGTATVSITVNPAPIVAITSPASGATVVGPDVEVSFSVQDWTVGRQGGDPHPLPPGRQRRPFDVLLRRRLGRGVQRGAGSNCHRHLCQSNHHTVQQLESRGPHGSGPPDHRGPPAAGQPGSGCDRVHHCLGSTPLRAG